MHCETFSTKNTAERTVGSNEAARSRLLSIRGEPLFLADWLRPVFIHYEVPAHVLQHDVPFELDLHHGKAYASLVAFTMRRMRPFRGGPFTAWLLKPIADNDFLNVRTYVRHRGEPGIYFLTEWMNNRISVHLGPVTFGLPYRFGEMNYQHHQEEGSLSGTVCETSHGPGLNYETNLSRHDSLKNGDRTRLACNRRRLAVDFVKPSFSSFSEKSLPDEVCSETPRPGEPFFTPCPTGSLDEFLLERYTAFTSHQTSRRFFRIWHEPWKQQSIPISIRDLRLLETVWPWFGDAKLIGAHYSPGAHGVWMGRPHRVKA